MPSRDPSCTLSLSLFTSASFSLRRVCSLLLPSSMCMGFYLRLLSHGYHDELAVLRVDRDCIAIAYGAIENAASDPVLDLPLNHPLHRTPPELWPLPHLCPPSPPAASPLHPP